MIVKVQQSIQTTEKTKQILVYNQSRTIEYQGDITEEIKEMMKGRLKVFFKAKLSPENQIILIKEVKEKDW